MLPDGEVRAEVIAVIVEVVGRVLGLRLVQPEHADPFVVVVLLDLGPDVFARRSLGCVEVERVALEVHRDAYAALRADEMAEIAHLREVLASVVDSRPDGDHQLDAHGPEAPRSCLRGPANRSDRSANPPAWANGRSRRRLRTAARPGACTPAPRRAAPPGSGSAACTARSPWRTQASWAPFRSRPCSAPGCPEGGRRPPPSSRAPCSRMTARPCRSWQRWLGLSRDCSRGSRSRGSTGRRVRSPASCGARARAPCLSGRGTVAGTGPCRISVRR